MPFAPHRSVPLSYQAKRDPLYRRTEQKVTLSIVSKLLPSSVIGYCEEILVYWNARRQRDMFTWTTPRRPAKLAMI
jgi:hypothetical protein